MSRLTEEELASMRRRDWGGGTSKAVRGSHSHPAEVDRRKLIAELEALRAERDAAVNAAQGIAAKLIPELDEVERRGFEACREEAAKIADRAAWADETDAAEIARDIRKLQPGTACTQGSGA